MDYSFSEKQRRIEYQASDEAKLLQNEVNSFNIYPWKYDSSVVWFTAEVNIYLFIVCVCVYMCVKCNIFLSI